MNVTHGKADLTDWGVEDFRGGQEHNDNRKSFIRHNIYSILTSIHIKKNKIYLHVCITDVRYLHGHTASFPSPSIDNRIVYILLLYFPCQGYNEGYK